MHEILVKQLVKENFRYGFVLGCFAMTLIFGTAVLAFLYFGAP